MNCIKKKIFIFYIYHDYYISVAFIKTIEIKLILYM